MYVDLCGKLKQRTTSYPRRSVRLLCDVIGDMLVETTSWRRLLYNFSQNTTFHGVRYVTADTQFVIRRYAPPPP